MGFRELSFDENGKPFCDLAKLEKKYVDKRIQMAALLRAQPGYTVVVTKKDYRELMEQEHTFERVVFAHFGAVAGKDVWVFPDANIFFRFNAKGIFQSWGVYVATQQ